MSTPAVLADNYFDTTVLHPDFVLTPSGELAGTEAFRVADNLRDMSWWGTGISTGSQISVSAPVGVVLTPTDLILDRGHNLGGHPCALQGSDDGFATGPSLLNFTPRATVGGLPTDAAGCLTPEGVFWKRFTLVGRQAWKLIIGTGLVPRVTGLYLGAAYRFPTWVDAPFAPDRRETVHARNVRSEGGVRVKARPITFRKPTIRLPVEDPDYPAFNQAVVPLLEMGHPWWWCHDDSTEAGAAELCVVQLEGDTLYEPSMDPVHREIELAFEEVIPRSRV